MGSHLQQYVPQLISTVTFCLGVCPFDRQKKEEEEINKKEEESVARK